MSDATMSETEQVLNTAPGDVLRKASIEELDVLRDILAKKRSANFIIANYTRDLAKDWLEVTHNDARPTDTMIESASGDIEAGYLATDPADPDPMAVYEYYRSRYGSCLGGELRLMGGNSIANSWRNEGPEYHEVVCDVAKKLKVAFHEAHPVERIERNILETVIEQVLEDLSPEQREELAKELADKGKGLSGPATTAALIAIFRAGRFESYKLALIVVNWIVKALIGRGLSVAANVALVRFLATFTGPVGWAITGLWAAIDLAGPAYTATIPSVVYVAMLRMGQAELDQGGEGDPQPGQGGEGATVDEADKGGEQATAAVAD